MARMIYWTGIGFVVGFVLIVGLFAMMGKKEPVVLAFSIMGALTFACIGSIFGAVSIIRDELDTMRREMMRLQRREEENTIHDVPSTQIKSGPTRE